MFLSRKLSIIFTLAIALGFALPCFGGEVALMIWVKDDGAFSQKKLVAETKVLGELSKGLEFRTIVLDKGHPHVTDADIGTVFGPTDTLSTLILSSHGGLAENTNTTSLSALGSFGEKGSEDEFQEILQKLRPYFQERLNIFANSCNTMAGTEDLARKRVEGLFKELQSYGVKDLFFWGAKKSLVSDARYANFRTLPAMVKLTFAGGSTLAGTVFSISLTGHVSVVPAIISSIVFYKTFKLAYKLIGENDISDEGLLVHANSALTEAETMKIFSADFAQSLLCNQAMQIQNPKFPI